MPIFDLSAIAIDITFGIVGLAVGSFLNVLALRSLKEESILAPASYCPHCRHSLGVAELIPVVSYWFQKGRCKHCRGNIAWYYPVVEAATSIFFIACFHVFGFSPYLFAMLFFGSTLIAITITDFKEKLIPHEITYPSIILGILFSASVRHDGMDTLAGVGISYILFDFLAFYGLKAYLWFNKPVLNLAVERPASITEPEHSHLQKRGQPKRLRIRGLSGTYLIAPWQKINEKIKQKLVPMANGQPVHEIEVMGGGDAVLSALIASWIGLPKLVYALLIGFMFGAFMGAIYLIVELHKHRLLHTCVKPVLYGMAGGFFCMYFLLFNIARMAAQPIPLLTWVGLSAVALVAGGLLGIVSTSHRVSKPFPFGPALAFGAFVAIFHNPFGKLDTGGA